MARSPGLSPEDLDLVIDATDHQPGQRRVLFEMVSHGASTGPTTWARLAREFGHVKGLRMALAEHPVASRTPEVRSVLLGSSDPGVVRALAPTLSRAELRAVWERRGKPALRPSLLLELLEGVSEEVRAELGRRDLLPLMRAADESVRLKAIRISGRLLGYAA